ncbi:MAG: L-threonylcarbamoyladenylate synthase [bacterium]|nr:L-threonylcarbamoyladenylate synthase [bacterium]
MSRPPPPGPVLIDLRVEPQRALEEATAALRAGRVVLLPTDTVYGLAALTPAAEEDLFALKGRPADRSIAVLVADRPAAESLAASVPEPLAELMDRHWPGPLTVVLPRPQTSVPQVGGNRETIGVRCPNHPWLRSLLAEVGPLATTSANRHAQQTPTHATEVLAALPPDPDAGAAITVAIDGGPCTGQASTVVTWQDGELKILRSGPLRLEPSNSA